MTRFLSRRRFGGLSCRREYTREDYNLKRAPLVFCDWRPSQKSPLRHGAEGPNMYTPPIFRSLHALVGSFLLSWNSSPYNHDATIAKVLAIHSGAAFIPGQVVTPSGLSVAVVTRYDRLWGPHPQSDSFCG